jgi:hypothetical protein
MKDKINTLEKFALENALNKNVDWYLELKKQIPYLSVTKRTSTARGGFVEFSLCQHNFAASIPKNDYKNYPPTISITHPLISGGGSFIIWTIDGVIDTLEYCIFDDTSWPIGIELDISDMQINTSP